MIEAFISNYYSHRGILEPGTLPYPAEIAARSSRLDPRLVKNFLRKYPTCFKHVVDIFVNEKLHNQWIELKELKQKQSLAGQKGNEKRYLLSSHPDSVPDRSASASASATAFKSSSTSIVDSEIEGFHTGVASSTNASQTPNPEKPIHAQIDNDDDEKPDPNSLWGILGINPRRFKTEDLHGARVFEGWWNDYGRPDQPGNLKLFLNDRINWCKANELHYPSVILLKLKDLQRRKIKPNGGFTSVSDIIGEINLPEEPK